MVDNLKPNELLTKLHVDKKGFLYLAVNPDYYKNVVEKILVHGAKYKAEKNMVITVDFSSPNIAK